jgi:predicted small lipoprotein YifL
MKNTIKLILATASVALLAACGGGGGGDLAAQAVFAPVSSVIQKVLETSNSYSANSSDGFRLSITFTPLEDAAFSNQTGVSKRTRTSTVLRQGDAVLVTEQEDIFYTANPFRVVAIDDRLIEETTTLPSSARADASGGFYFSEKVGVGLFTTLPRLVGTWSVETSSDRLLWICWTNTEGDGLLSAPGFETTSIGNLCFKTNEAGDISGFKASISSDSESTSANPSVTTLNFGAN